jgi:hypothetical protein
LDIRFDAFGLGSIHSSQAHAFTLSARLNPFTRRGYCEAVRADPKRHVQLYVFSHFPLTPHTLPGILITPLCFPISENRDGLRLDFSILS